MTTYKVGDKVQIRCATMYGLVTGWRTVRKVYPIGTGPAADTASIVAVCAAGHDLFGVKRSEIINHLPKS